jgi:hypothetical protein
MRKRAFILGNGPSLRDTPLDLLNSEVSYAVNAIHLLYNTTDWRPTHLVIGDVTAAHRDWVHEGMRDNDERTRRFLDIINANPDAVVHIRGNYRSWATRLLDRDVDYFSVCSHHSLGVGETLETKAPHEWHLPQICRWGGSVLMAIQLAARSGYKPLYLLGCDLNYAPGTGNHFADDYDEPIDAAKASALNAVIGHAHELAATQWDIYNAGRDGSLEAYERVGLEELF